ncbi:MAG: hypothetical protein FWF95_06335, partial [Syntrophorhabdaceae bacterium]|nr:hypothetical protein [Syntrophorhabdaceae bacterium]
ALAIPNFLKFQAKSRASEAKTNLNGIYTAQSTHFSEFGYFGNFIQISWLPIGRTLIYGYSLDGNITGTQMVNQPIACNAAGTMYSPSLAVAGTMSWGAPATHVYLGTMTPGVTADNLSFIAGAAGQVAPRNSLADCWVINDNNVLLNTQSGI